MMNQITALLGRAIIPAGLGLFVTGVAAGESALTTWKARIIGLLGIVIIALASSVVQSSLMLSLICFIAFGFTLRQVFA